MASKKTKKTVERTAKKIYKKNKKKPVFWIILIIALLLVIGLVAGYIYMNPDILSGLKHNNNDDTTTSTKPNNSSSSNSVEGVIYDDFQIHFLEFENNSAGDSIYIKAGDNDILIDAGNKKDNSTKLSKQINEYCTDNKLEYVIVTHGDQDHIQSFIGSSANATNGLLYTYDVDNIIYNNTTTKSSKIYQALVSAINKKKESGTTVTYAKDFFESDNLTAKSSATIKLSDYVTMQVLWNKYYFTTSSDENNYSVSVLFNYTKGSDTHNFILTGDLEKEGEEAMVAHYSSSTYGTLPHVDLYKGGHHGSKTSSTNKLLSAITPEICCVCTCAGTNEYTTDYTNQFPTQHFINRIAQYTDKVYVTGLYSNGTFSSMNGQLIVSCGTNSTTNQVEVSVASTNNLTKLKDSEWFNETIYVKNYKEASSTDLDDVNSTPHGDNSAKSGDNTFYTASDEGVTAVKRRIWPSSN